VIVFVFQFTAQSDERLDVAPRTDDVDYDVQRRWEGDVSRCGRKGLVLFLVGRLLDSLDLGSELVVNVVYEDVYAAVVL